MDSFEFNKIAGAVLATALVVFGLKELAGAVYHTSAPEKPGFLIEVAEASGTAETPADAGPAVSIGTLLAAADVTKGAATAKACMACHDFTKGGPNKTGPHLWDVGERDEAGDERFPGLGHNAGAGLDEELAVVLDGVDFDGLGGGAV